ncbi:hypothetical protein [Cohnella phaseoli]|uniref:Uncharacterized protein n=1 Tax=Cohnella phaseoli TaxID=456490 RepID=A0A3D9JRD6_9BACL|nr:hypothetical protein [Cohnella phaseoli]RED76107.1 hypothetical protein DFP98_113168 [Cohnella phaseoli]
MGTTWTMFKSYEIGRDIEWPGGDIIRYLEREDLYMGSGTAFHLAMIFEHFGVLLPVYDWTEPPKGKALDLIHPSYVLTAAESGLILLRTDKNPQVKAGYSAVDDEPLEPLFNDEHLQRHSVEQLNHELQSYLEKILLLSGNGHYLVRSFE